MVKCNACGGTFEPLGLDGVRYFHVCAPLSSAELRAAVLAGKAVLPGGETVDDAVARRLYLRTNRRDENVPSTAASDAGKLKAIGADVTPVAAPAPPIVVVP